jgi:hypothetical protein
VKISAPANASDRADGIESFMALLLGVAKLLQNILREHIKNFGAETH